MVDSFVISGACKATIGQLVIDTYGCAHRFEMQEIWDIFSGRRDGGVKFRLCKPDSGFPGVVWRKDLHAFLVSYRTQHDSDQA